MSTQPDSLLNEETVSYYVDVIGKGERPFLICLNDGGAFYLLDGHHKRAAYDKLNIPYQVLSIERLDLHIFNQKEIISEYLKEKFYNYFKDSSAYDPKDD